MTKAESTLRDLDTAASKIGLQIQVARARTVGEIDAAFAAFAGERPDGRLHMQRCLADAAFASEEQMPRRCCQKLWNADHKSRFSRVKHDASDLDPITYFILLKEMILDHFTQMLLCEENRHRTSLRYCHRLHRLLFARRVRALWTR